MNARHEATALSKVRAPQAAAMSKRRFLQECLGGCAFLLAAPALRPATALGRAVSALADDPARWTKEAMFWKSVDGGVQCEKCPHGCLLPPGATGLCRNRTNRDGRMVTTAYGNPCAVHIDPIEKKPLLHFLPSTRAYSLAVAGCNFRCLNCQNWQISQVAPEETQHESFTPDEVVSRCRAEGCASIAYTYSEPTTFYEYAHDIARLARARGVRNVWKSNGFINDRPLRTLCRYLDAANIDLKAFDDGIYGRLSSGSLAPVLRTLTTLHEEGVWLEITNLVIPEWTDDLGMIGRMAEWLVSHGLRDCPLHFTRFVPLYKLVRLPLTPVSVLERAREIALKAGMHYVYIGNVPGHAAENTYCHGCGAMIVERKGYTIRRFAIKDGRCAECGIAVPGRWEAT